MLGSSVGPETAWTLTARINDEGVWVEEGTFAMKATSDSEESDEFTITLSTYTVMKC